MAELYKQKYLKYKSKYNELKRNVNIHRYETTQFGGANVVSIPVAGCAGIVNAQPSVLVPGKYQLGGASVTISSIPVADCAGIVNAQPSVLVPGKYQLGGANVTISSIPVDCAGIVNAQPSVIVPGKNQEGGANVTISSIPVVDCVGIVNAQPSVIVPGKNQEGGASVTISSIPIADCAGIVNAQPSVIVPGKNQEGGDINTYEDFNTTTEFASENNNSVNSDDVANINDTDDMVTLFNQLGGGHKHKNNNIFTDSSSIFDSDSTSIFGSDFDDEISLNEI